MTRASWTDIRDAIAKDIEDGALEPGSQLPTEPELVARFGVGRHSVRRAVNALAREGKLSVEQGRGTFIESAPLLTYAIGRRTRLRQNLVPQAYDVSGELLAADLVDARGRVREALKLPKGAKVVESKRMTLADDVPIAFGSMYHDAARFSDIVERRDLLGSMTATYRSYGIEDYVRKETTIHSRPARADEAKLLRQHEEMPVLVVRAIDAELDGRPLSYSQVIWAASRVTFAMHEGDDDDN